MENNMNLYPPIPWNMRVAGTAAAGFYLVDKKAIREKVPREFDLVTVWPGKTLGVVFYARYGPGSDVEYNELGVFPALVRYGMETGFWASSMFVDNEKSVELARKELGLPKSLARFSVTEEKYPDEYTRITVTSAEKEICSMRITPSRKLGKTVMGVSAFGNLESQIIFFGARWEAEHRSASGMIFLPPEHSLGFLLEKPILISCARNMTAELGRDARILGRFSG